MLSAYNDDELNDWLRTLTSMRVLIQCLYKMSVIPIHKLQ